MNNNKELQEDLRGECAYCEPFDCICKPLCSGGRTAELGHFKARHPEASFGSDFCQLTPQLLDTARPYEVDGRVDISVYPSHVENNGVCDPETCEAVSLVNTVHEGGPSFATWEAAEAFIAEMKQMPFYQGWKQAA